MERERRTEEREKRTEERVKKGRTDSEEMVGSR